MEEKLKMLYQQEIDQSFLDFDRDPESRVLYTGSGPLGRGRYAESFYHLLDTGNFLSFAHGFRLGVQLAGWTQEG